jgi:hypothetical protein
VVVLRIKANATVGSSMFSRTDRAGGPAEHGRHAVYPKLSISIDGVGDRRIDSRQSDPRKHMPEYNVIEAFPVTGVPEGALWN